MVPEKWQLLILRRAEFAKSFSLNGVTFTDCHFWQSVFATDIVIVWNGVWGRNSLESLNSIISLEWDKPQKEFPEQIKISDCVWITENRMEVYF